MLREKTLARQKKLGVVPEDAELTARHDEIPAWDDMPDELKPVLARQMEIYAGFLEQTDHEIGRVVDAIEDLGILDDTLIYYIIGDNGASAEGTLNGCFNEMTTLNGMPGIETTEFLLSKIDDFGTPNAYNHYAVGWAHALCTPYQWTKQVASHWGGTRNGTIVHWPNGIEPTRARSATSSTTSSTSPRRSWRRRACPHRPSVNGIAQAPLEGVSMLATLRDAKAPETHDGSVLRDVRQSRHLPPGLDRGDQAPHPVEGRHPAAVRRRRLGALRSRRLDAGARSRRRESGEAGRAATALADRGGQVQRAFRSTIAASSASIPTSPAGRS